MKAQLDNVLEKLKKLRVAYSGDLNLVRIGFGLKEAGGVTTMKKAFRFYVKEKLPLSGLSESQLIPAEIDGIATDVIRVGQIHRLTSVASAPPINQESFRNSGLRGGACIRNEHFENDHPSGYGTLGVLARRVADNQLVGLTCSHVGNNASDTPQTEDTKIGHPKYYISCCCCPRGEIGLLKSATLNNDLDCALIEIDEDTEEKVNENTSENKIEGFPLEISGAALPAPDQVVKKYGQATGLTTGKIIDEAFGVNQMLIELQGGAAGAAFANHGDSGAVIVNDDNQVIGLLVAAWQDPAIAGAVGAQTRPALTKGIATYIKPIMAELDITIAGVAADEVTLPVLAKPWPGGQTDSNLNPKETFTSADFGFTGNVDWDVSGRAPGAIIIESGTQTASGLSSITVRYDTVSASSAKADAVEIKATKNGDDLKQLRTVVKITPRLNTTNPLDGNNSLRFIAGSGTDNQAGVAVSGVDGASQFRAKAEIIYDLLPPGAQWDGAGATNFVVGSPVGTAGEVVARRQTKFNKGRQATADPNRIHTEELNWVSAGDSVATDFQEPTNALPDAIFRLANDGFDPAGLKQAYDRADYRDYLEMHDGTAWIPITPYLEWHANLTADLDPSGGAATAGTTNNIGAGATAALIPNQPPVVSFASSHREINLGESLTITPVINDPDNDLVELEWEQLRGPDLGWTNKKRTGANLVFNAPNDDFLYEFKIVGNDGTGGLARTAGNHLSTAEEKMTLNVIEWKQKSGGYPLSADNEVEVFNSNNFGFNGPVNWDVTTGGTQTEIIEADGNPIASTGVTQNATTIKVRYNNNSSNGTRSKTVIIKASNSAGSINWFKRRSVVKVTITMKDTGTIVASPENEDYASMKAAAGGIDNLGVLPMGSGRVNFPNETYTAATLMVAELVGHMPSTVFRWKRFLTRRSWLIFKNAAGTEWHVTQRSRRGFPSDDTGHADFFDNTPSVALNRIYFYDNSALAPNQATLGLVVGDFVNEEKDFTYKVEYQDGVNWIKCTEKRMGQIITVRRIATTGTVPTDWAGVENSTAFRTVSATITIAEVRAIVGGVLPININPTANN